MLHLKIHVSIIATQIKKTNIKASIMNIEIDEKTTIQQDIQALIAGLEKAASKVPPFSLVIQYEKAEKHLTLKAEEIEKAYLKGGDDYTEDQVINSRKAAISAGEAAKRTEKRYRLCVAAAKAIKDLEEVL